VLGATALVFGQPPAAPSIPEIKTSRVDEIARQLTARPVFFTPPFSDRVFWDARAREKSVVLLLANADRLAAEPIPELDAPLFAEYSRTGVRKSYELPFSERTHRLNVFLFAEGLSASGRYLSVIERELAAILDEPTWAAPAHVQGQSDWTRCRQVIDLAAAARAWSVATTDFLLGDRLAPATRARIRAEVRDRVLMPYAKRAREGGHAEHLFRWMTGLSNWNAVCNAGVCGAALLLCETPVERAWFAAAFETLTGRFLDGYAGDGYCHEGIGYWVYGFGHYAMAAEAIRLSTSGAIDLSMQNEKVRRIGRFGADWEIIGGMYPPFGDSKMERPPPAWLDAFCTRRYGAAAGVAEDRSPDGLSYYRHGLGAHLFVTAFDLASSRSVGSASPAPPPPPRSWYPEGGALVARSTEPGRGLAVAFKGGDNGQSHRHHDLGSYVVLCDGEPLLIDPGRDTYVRDTFSEKRFTSGLMNSFGHPVPRVAGRLQRDGAEARAVTVRTVFTDDIDVWEIDLTSAYDVPELEQLTRTFTFSRANGGRLEIRDRVTFRTPQIFGSALILSPDQRRETMDTGSCRVHGKTTHVHVSWIAIADGRTEAAAVKEEPVFGIVPEEGAKAVRIGLDLAAPAREATLTVVITPRPRA
jgi:hypothetical protein